MMEKRLASLENGIGLIINKLDGITTSINSSHQNSNNPSNININTNNNNSTNITGTRK